MTTPIRTATRLDYEQMMAGTYMDKGWDNRARGFVQQAHPWRHRRWLEVGAGRGDLAKAMRAEGWDWTPCDMVCPHDGRTAALPELVGIERADFDCVASFDVLEHIDEAHIPRAIRRMREVGPSGQLHAIANMRDRRMINDEVVELHLTQRPAEWWVEQFSAQRAKSWAVPCDFAPDLRFFVIAVW